MQSGRPDRVPATAGWAPTCSPLRQLLYPQDGRCSPVARDRPLRPHRAFSRAARQ